MIALVYQQGIANVFRVDAIRPNPDGTVSAVHPVLYLRHTCETCYWYAKGLADCCSWVETFHCEHRGDIANVPWHRGTGDLFGSVRPMLQSKRPDPPALEQPAALPAPTRTGLGLLRLWS